MAKNIFKKPSWMSKTQKNAVPTRINGVEPKDYGPKFNVDNYGPQLGPDNYGPKPKVGSHSPWEPKVKEPAPYNQGDASININNLKPSEFMQDRLGGQIKSTLGTGWENIKTSTGGNVLGAVGSHAVRGAIGGAAIGGTMEAAQGGDFWAGAKSGAFNGAVGWTGYRMGMRATGANSLNPLKGLKSTTKGSQGIIAGGRNMFNTYSSDAGVSKQARALLNNTTRASMARQLTTRNGG